MQLIIVESPTKTKTLQKFLGPEYKILASYGHIRDLPKSELGVDLENNFQPKYIVPVKARKIINLLKKETEKAEMVLLACDPDREGEAIAWHLTQILNLNGAKPYQRISFNEITKTAIENALKNPRKIDQNLVNAQQARRILDRIVGYQLSPFLWKKVARGLSAGRVQSVAVRLICEREKEIINFVPQEYWTLSALLCQNKENSREFTAELIKKDGKTIPPLGIKTKEEATKIINDLKKAKYQVINIEKKETKKNPLPPFITSNLQQEAWQKFKWPAKLTMQVAQQLYETGFITYMRTDSFNISDLALGAAKTFIIKNYGQNYYQFRQYKTKSKVAQEAHEAIRPTYPQKTPESLKLNERQLKLYDLIWRRFIASQMSSALFQTTTADIAAQNYLFRAKGQILQFAGFLKVYLIKYEETELPDLALNEILKLIKLIPSQHFTQPPARYTEATLIKTLESFGIGRPSTYAPILSTIQERNYVKKDEKKRFQPTEIGLVVNDILTNHFPEIVDIGFTAKMEENLDKIAANQKQWLAALQEFYTPFQKNLQKKYKEVLKKDFTEKPTEEKCPQCGAPLIIRLGRYGKFYACSRFPQCRYTAPLKENELDIACPKCQKGKIVEKRTKKHKIFYACNQYPECDFALWDKPIKEKCPQCGSLLVETKRKQIKCSNPACGFVKK
ncbi:MAG: type I DNA topoisomerase [Minisyncoccales bacterium]